MENYIVNNDMVTFLPSFTPATIVPVPGKITASAAKTNATKKAICLEGDESSVTVSGVAYIGAAFPVPGVGQLTITKLNADQTSKKTKIEGKAPIVKGTMFTAKFTVQTPASLITPGGKQDDPVPTYTGQGQFVPSNMTVMDKG